MYHACISLSEANDKVDVAVYVSGLFALMLLQQQALSNAVL